MQSLDWRIEKKMNEPFTTTKAWLIDCTKSKNRNTGYLMSEDRDQSQWLRKRKEGIGLTQEVPEYVFCWPENATCRSMTGLRVWAPYRGVPRELCASVGFFLQRRQRFPWPNPHRQLHKSLRQSPVTSHWLPLSKMETTICRRNRDWPITLR